MITIFLLVSAFMIIGTILPFFIKFLFAIFALVLEVAGYVFLFSLIGIAGIVVFVLIDFVVLKIMMKILLIK